MFALRAATAAAAQAAALGASLGRRGQSSVAQNPQNVVVGGVANRVGSAGGSFGRAFASAMAPWQPQREPVEDLCSSLAAYPEGPYIPITQAGRMPIIAAVSDPVVTRKQILKEKH
mmetsp:Transcript_15631/g.43207  ORF Transcript_15631/g.43207 Transcript_15631/m.43207 type:complete len:116 (-) Transcript_15631:183-530(-)